MTTSVPNIQFTPTGLILPTEQEILEGVLTDINNAFGGGLNRNLETPQGQLASSIAAIISDKNNQIAWLVNNLDPDYSDGIMQDAIGKIYFIKRKGKINSSVTCEFNGLPGTIIPKGFVVKDEQGNEWSLDQEISILENGKVSGTLTADGIYGAKANTITQLTQAIIGLDRVTNPQDATPGVDVENRRDFAERYHKSVAINSQGMPASVYANVSKLPGVSDCYVIDNPKDEVVRVGATNKELIRHSIYVAVVGGDDKAIAETIWRYAGNGCDYNGNKTVIVKDERYLEPKPSYEIKFQRPSDLPVYFQIKIKRGADLNAEENIRASILKNFRESRLKIGTTIFAIGYVADLVGILGKEFLLDVKVGKSGTQFSDQLEVGIDQIPTISENNIKVVVV